MRIKSAKSPRRRDSAKIIHSTIASCTGDAWSFAQDFDRAKVSADFSLCGFDLIVTRAEEDTLNCLCDFCWMPQKSKPDRLKPVLPKLNQRAPDFRSFFSSGRAGFFPTSGRASGINPSRLGMRTFGRVSLSIISFASMISFRFSRNAVTA